MSSLAECCCVNPAVLASSGSAAAGAAGGIVLMVKQATQTKLNQDNFLLASGEEGEEGAGPPCCTVADKESKERRPRLTLAKLHIVLCCRINLEFKAGLQHIFIEINLSIIFSIIWLLVRSVTCQRNG